MSLVELHKAFTRFYNTHKDEVYGYILVRVSFDEATSADIVSDIFIKAYDSFDLTIVNTRSWIFTISKNTLIDYYRKSKTQSWEISDLDKMSDEDDTIYHQLEVELTMRQIRKHIAALSPKQKNIVESYYIHERTTTEISQDLEMKESSVRKNLSRGLKKLKRLYEE